MTQVLFVGSGAFGEPTLKALAASGQCVGVVTATDKKAGRKHQLTPTPIGIAQKRSDCLALKQTISMQKQAFTILSLTQWSSLHLVKN